MWNKIKRYSGMAFGRPQVVGGEYYDRKIRNYIRSGYTSTRDRPGTKIRSVSSLSRKFGRRAGRYAGTKRSRAGRILKSAARIKRMRHNRQAILYKSILKHGLTQPAVEIDSFGGNIAQIGTNLQGYCQWYAFPMETTPGSWDRILAAASNAAIGSVNANQQVWFDGCKNAVNMRNASNHTCNVQVFKCYPRIDIPISLVVVGANPALFQTGFTNTSAEAKATGAIAYNMYNATPYMSSTWCSAFKMKRILQSKLEPGQTLDIKHSRRLGYLVKKSSYLLGTSSSFAGVYNHTRKNGPIYLVKVWGDIVHNEASVAFPMATNSLSPTTGGFNLDFLFHTRITYRAPFVTPTRVSGYYALPAQNILIANETQWLEDAPAESATDA